MGSTGFSTILSISRLGSVHKRKRVLKHLGTSACQCFLLSRLVPTYGLQGFSDLTLIPGSDLIGMPLDHVG